MTGGSPPDSTSAKSLRFPSLSSITSSDLCSNCRGVDFSPLAAPLPSDDGVSRDAASTYEEKLAIYIEDFSINKAKRKSSKCLLCALLAECGNRTGESKRLLHVRCCIRPKLRWSHASRTSGGQEMTKLEHTGQIHVWFHEIKSYNKSPALPTNRTSIGARLWNGLHQVPEPSLPGSSSQDPPDETPDPIPVDLDGNPVGRSFRDRVTSPRSSGIMSKLFASKPRTQTTSFKSAIASWMIDIAGHDGIAEGPRRISIAATADTTQLSEWLRECDNGHSHSSESHIVSPRISRVLERGVLRLINTSTGNIETHTSLVNFTALSYVWGQTVGMTPTLQSSPIAEHAPTIRDAAELTEYMGIEWLWVDRICIDQNNEEEKTFLIPYIKDIFAAAQLTIIAASGDGAHTGLPGTKRTPRAPSEIETPVKIKCGETALELLAARPSFNALLEPCVRRTRGWTFEEQVFSRRVLFIFPSEIIFSCCKGTFRESSGSRFTAGAAGSTWGDSGATPPIIASEINAKVYTESQNLVSTISGREFVRAAEEYTTRNLTVEEDRISAFAGLISITAGSNDQVPERPLLKHGHPLRFFETALTWQSDEKSDKRYPKFGKPFAPSWSWASAGTKVHFLDNGEENDRSCWFDFELLGGYDVLGLPRQNAGLVGRLGLDKPSQILASQPWTSGIQDPPSYTSEPGLESVDMALDLPKLHLVTVIFEALFASRGGHESHDYLQAVDYKSGQDETLVGRWSIDSSERARLNSPTRTLFAIVAGNLNIYVMALKPESGHNTYSRMGILRVSFYSDQLFFEIMRRGLPRWEYIRLI